MDAIVEGRVLLDTGIENCCIGIEDGKISKIAKTIERADKRYSLSNMIILPSAIDLHVHFRDPGLTHKEDFETGSMAAACGGVTYVLDMPNTKPPTRNMSDVEEKIEIGSKKSYVDFGVAALLNDRTDCEKVASKSTAFKIYLGETTGSLGVPPDSLGQLIASASRTDRPIMIHAEHLGRLKDGTERNLSDHDRRRSGEQEISAAKFICESISGNAKLHLLHVTQNEILDLARKKGVSTEVTPHHLLLDTECGLGTRAKINPPIRSKSVRARLWEAFCEGRCDTLGSDHSPHTIGEKEDDFDAAPCGMPGVETMLPLMLKLVADRKIKIQTLVRSCARRPAEIIGIDKGRISVGMDADLIAVDLTKASKIQSDRLHSKCGWTPFEGMEAIFPSLVLIGGEEVARDGSITGDRRGMAVIPGRGQE